MLTPGHIILSIPISFDWIVVCAAVQTSTQPPYITHQDCASHQHQLLFNSIFNHLILLQHHTLADHCYSTVLQYLQQLLSLYWVIIKADHYFLSDYTALIHCIGGRQGDTLLRSVTTTLRLLIYYRFDLGPAGHCLGSHWILSWRLLFCFRLFIPRCRASSLFLIGHSLQV